MERILRWARAVIYPVIGVLLSGAAAGCARSGADVPGEVASTAKQELGSPTTITLTTPTAVSPISPVMTGVQSIFIGGTANVISGSIVAGGSGLDIEPDGKVNETWSQGLATLRDRVDVRGTLHASSVSLGNQVVIAARDSSPQFTPPQTLSWTVTFPQGTGANVLLNAGNSTTLTPGLYGNVTLNSQASLTLEPGTYYLSGLDLEAQSVVNLDQGGGPIIIYVANSVIYRGTFTSLTGAEPDLAIAYLGQNQVFLESLFDGAFVAPFATLTLREVQGIHTGYFYANSINNQDASTRVQYRVPAALVSAANPNPTACFGLLGSLVPPDAIKRYCSQCFTLEDNDRDGVPNCADQCENDPLKTAPGACGCGVPDVDTDGDGVPDCIDECPNDPNNVFPGQCGCLGQTSLQPAGTFCTDTACPQSGATCDGHGVCGNRAACAPAAGCSFVNGRGVSYWFCPALPKQGVPPDAGVGAFDAGGGSDAGGAGQGVTESAAQASCSSKGLTLGRVGSLSDAFLLRRLIQTPVWLGANDLSVPGTWRWSAPGTNNGDVFWSGGATGSPVNGLFTYWAPGAPGANQCATMRPGDGLWVDTNCSSSLGYFCEYVAAHAPYVPVPVPGQLKSIPPLDQTQCVSEFGLDAGGLPDSTTELLNELDAASQDVFIGAAANPPPATAPPCPLDPSSENIGLDPSGQAGCAFTNVQRTATGCLTDSDCAVFGTGFVCRQDKDDVTCNPPDAADAPPVPVDGSTCRGHAVCGQVVCPPDTLPCDQRVVCTPNVLVDAGPEATQLSPQPFDPASLFDGAVPDASPAPDYFDPPVGQGENHSWCHMTPQNQVPAGDSPGMGRSGNSGSGAKISFGFQPDLVFHADPNPLSFNESSMLLHTAASLRATASLNNFLGASFTADILNASAGLRADRCSISDTETHLTVLGLDFLSAADLGIPLFDSAQAAPQFTQECNDAVQNFILWANRAKKAFRDAQQLLSQYHGAASNGLRVANDLCPELIGLVNDEVQDIPFFPGGLNCPSGEPVEFTVNRFLDYLQAPGYGQLTQLEAAVTRLATATTNVLTQALQPIKVNKNLTFGGDPQEEDETVVSVQFAIGPVPMVLEIDAFAAYGIKGFFDFDFQFPINAFGGLGDSDSSKMNKDFPIADVKAGALPYASAGVSAFVGVGFSLGPLEASIGLEGDVTLAQVQAPIYGGAGIVMSESFDRRTLPLDIAPPISLQNAFAFNLPDPKSVRFSIYYDYGAGVDLVNVLSGSIQATLKIKFFFFSRTWHKQVIAFNGWSFHFDLIKGGNLPPGSTGGTMAQSIGGPADPPTDASTTNVTEGTTPSGFGQAEFPLTILSYLPVPPTTDIPPDAALPLDGSSSASTSGPDAGTVEFDSGPVQGMFYDSLCCAKLDEPCTSTTNNISRGASPAPFCCPGTTCVQLPQDAGPLLIPAICEPQCASAGQNCKQNSDCCVGTCLQPYGVCVNPCVGAGGSCVTTNDCCSPATCDDTSHLCVNPVRQPE